MVFLEVMPLGSVIVFKLIPIYIYIGIHIGIYSILSVLDIYVLTIAYLAELPSIAIINRAMRNCNETCDSSYNVNVT